MTFTCYTGSYSLNRGLEGEGIQEKVSLEGQSPSKPPLAVWDSATPRA
jgi:hypothetical protein